MRLRVLGTAAGGGVPQWNCACPGCAGARAHTERRRTHASLAVELDGRAYIVNATPDIGAQIESCPWLWPGPGHRDSPIAGVILTDAELDHTLGLARLREAEQIEIVATPAVRHALAPMAAILAPYTNLIWRDLTGPEGIAVSGKRPRYAQDGPESGWVSALRLGPVVYAPCVGTLSPALFEAIADAEVVIFDGTFWDDDEPRTTGISEKTATQMGHLPIERTAPVLAKLAGRVLYTHLNNTNPLVDPAAPQHKLLAELGLEVAQDGCDL